MSRSHSGKATPQRRLLRARTVLPVSRPPIEDGAVLVQGQRILEVGSWPALRRRRAPVADLGEVVLMPGLINAHCHLDYTHMSGQFPPPRTFSDWLKQITEAKSGWDLSDYAASWQAGAAMLLRTGTTTVADIEAVPELLPDMWEATPLRVFSFFEMIGISRRRSPADIVQEALARIRDLGGNAGLSPHAPYSTVPELLSLAATAARTHGHRIVSHVAESRLEYDMFRRKRGEMYRWMRRATRDMSDCGNCTPVQHLDRCGILGENFLAVHANYLGRHDPALLAIRGASVVHCPRSHFYFRHEAFPLRRLLRAGVNVCLGTDSLASVYIARKERIQLSMFDEMRAMALAHPSLNPVELVRMATVNGAKALGLAGEVGELKPQAFADLVALPIAGPIRSVYDAVLGLQEHVSASMIAGHWGIPPDSR